MSNALAIASVTRLLKDLLNNTVVDGDISADVGTDVLVTALPPDRVLEMAGETLPTQLNIFLHRVTPNPALANSDLPTRDGRGQIVNTPRLALDLHYLLTAYAAQELHAEVLLGYAMEMFHENPIIPRGAIRNALASGVNGSMLPPAFQSAAASRLADQVELIKITLQPLSMDDMSKLWTALQTHYRTTVAYQVSVVLIEREQPRRSPLPVLSRGPVDPATGRDAGVVTQPGLMPTVPTLCGVAPADGRPAARLGDTIEFTGFNLDDGDARALFTDAETGDGLELAPVAPATPERLQVQLPSGPPLPGASPLAGTGGDPGAWRIGPYLVRLVLRSGASSPSETNAMSVLLAPRTTPSAGAVPGGVEIAVACEPRIRENQSVAVVIGGDETPLPALSGDVDQVAIVRDDLTSGAELPVRLRVAGVDSLLIDRSAEPPAFESSQIVVVP